MVSFRPRRRAALVRPRAAPTCSPTARGRIFPVASINGGMEARRIFLRPFAALPKNISGQYLGTSNQTVESAPLTRTCLINNE
jgi:hypothetical protein